MMNTTLEHVEQQAVTIRVVFDGAPYAGKTTAAYSLGQTLGGSPETPSEEDGRTVWFDWMSYDGGTHGDKAVRVELVTVPGQEHLASRRRHLLAWGDVVVFIADTRQDSFAASVAKFEELRSDLGDTPTPIVIVANKRDLEDAVPVADVRRELDLADSTPVVEAVATSGGGIREAFIYAVRAALEASVSRVEATTPDELLDDMKERFESEPFGELEAVAPAEGTEASMTATAAADAAERAAARKAGVEHVGIERDVVDAEDVGIERDLEDAEDVGIEHDLEDAENVADQNLEDTEDTEDAEDAEDIGIEHALEGTEDVGIEHDVVDAENAADPIDEFIEEIHDSLTEDVVPPATPAAPSTVLRNARLNPDGIAEGGAVVVLAEHWHMLVEVAEGRSVLPLDDASEEAAVTYELAEWGLITGTKAEVTPESVADAMHREKRADSSMATENQRYRELRSLRRTIRN